MSKRPRNWTARSSSVQNFWLSYALVLWGSWWYHEDVWNIGCPENLSLISHLYSPEFSNTSLLVMKVLHHGMGELHILYCQRRLHSGATANEEFKSLDIFLESIAFLLMGPPRQRPSHTLPHLSIWRFSELWLAPHRADACKVTFCLCFHFSSVPLVGTVALLRPYTYKFWLLKVSFLSGFCYARVLPCFNAPASMKMASCCLPAIEKKVRHV